ALDRAEAAFDRGELEESIRQAQTAATLQLPGAAHVDLAYTRLIAIARGAEAVGRPHLAARAWSAIREAAVETRHPLLESRPELEAAEQNLARLAAASQSREPEGPVEQRLLAGFARPTQREGDSAIGLGLGLVVAVIGLFWTGARGVTREGKWNARHVLVGVLCSLIGAACWTWAAYRA
ncbi:MAG TPA: hypothetical protein VFQ61_28565, partial [Polyangiaceae bacterium]|nr:hypothetical protein [Polyangiaceae bacterium]